MDIISKQFFDLAIRHSDNMLLYKPMDAIKVIERCRELGEKLHHAEAFRVFNNGEFIQPDMEFDFNVPDDFKGNAYQTAIKHVTKFIDTDIVFEIIFDAYYSW